MAEEGEGRVGGGGGACLVRGIRLFRRQGAFSPQDRLSAGQTCARDIFVKRIRRARGTRYNGRRAVSSLGRGRSRRSRQFARFSRLLSLSHPLAATLLPSFPPHPSIRQVNSREREGIPRGRRRSHPAHFSRTPSLLFSPFTLSRGRSFSAQTFRAHAKSAAAAYRVSRPLVRVYRCVTLIRRLRSCFSFITMRAMRDRAQFR